MERRNFIKFSILSLCTPKLLKANRVAMILPYTCKEVMCGYCAAECPVQAIYFEKIDVPLYRVSEDDCIDCSDTNGETTCQKVCPVNAIILT